MTKYKVIKSVQKMINQQFKTTKLMELINNS